MSILQSAINNIGDVLGTSKLSKLNRTIFSPVLKTEINRKEYDACNGPDLFSVPSGKEADAIKGFNNTERGRAADKILGAMVENGAVFSERRIVCMVAAQQTQKGVNPVSFKVMDQMSDLGRQKLGQALQRQYGFGY